MDPSSRCNRSIAKASNGVIEVHQKMRLAVQNDNRRLNNSDVTLAKTRLRSASGRRGRHTHIAFRIYALHNLDMLGPIFVAGITGLEYTQRIDP
jgi:hypothetical protein